MKYLYCCLLALPLITSCVEQGPDYEQNYYNPPAHVEVEQNDYPQRHYHNNNGYHSPAAPQGRVIHGHPNVNQNNIIVNSPPPQGHVQAQQNVHGHGGNNGNLVRHPSENGGAVVVPGKAHGHGNNNDNSKAQQPEQSGEGQNTTHGHN